MNQDVIGVTVQLLGIDYRIACRRDERAGLIAAAHHLDSKMREVRDHSSKLLSPDAIAVMSALNVSYEWIQQQQQLTEQDTVLRHHTQDLLQKVDDLLSKAAAAGL